VYHGFFPNDKVIVDDAHQYLLEHFDEFDFIWSSPPCPTHSHIRKELVVEQRKQNKPVYPDMKLYEEILFLMGYFKGKWVIENVISWYNPLIKPQELAHHYFWANFIIGKFEIETREHHGTIFNLAKRKNVDLSKLVGGIDKRAVLRNCVEPEVGLHIFNSAFNLIQQTLKETAIPPTTKVVGILAEQL
jgi:DNA (cytosine-5)-methyltransferase 1